jgi:hypothetical protein
MATHRDACFRQVTFTLHSNVDRRRHAPSIDVASRPIEFSEGAVRHFDLNQIVCGFPVFEVAAPRGKSRCSQTPTLNG